MRIFEIFELSRLSAFSICDWTIPHFNGLGGHFRQQIIFGEGARPLEIARIREEKFSKEEFGAKTPVCGQYRNNTTRKEVTIVPGEPPRPVPESGQISPIAKKTKHKR